MRRRKISPISDQLTAFVVLILLAPLLLLMIRTWGMETDNWEHIRKFLLGEAVITTLWLAFLSVAGAGIIGVLAAWLVSCFDFPFKKAFEWLLVLPIAMPPYIAAYVFAGMLSYTGTVQVTARSLGITIPQNWLDIMSLPGAAFIFIITLYPYVYLIVKSFLKQHSNQFVENARVLGYGSFTIFVKVILPLVRVPLIGAMFLVLMETVSDFGVVKYYGLQTMSTLIFKSWFGMRDLGLAGRLSISLLVGIMLLQIAEEWLRGKRGYSIGAGKSSAMNPVKLSGIRSALAIGFLSSVFVVALVIPVAQMLHWSTLAIGKVNVPKIVAVFASTVGMSTLAALIILVLSLFIAHRSRFFGPRLAKLCSRLIQVGYSVPGAIIAVGTLILFVSIDGTLYPLYLAVNPDTKKLVLTSGLGMLLFAYVVRYMAIGYNSVQSGFVKIGSRFREASSVLGYSSARGLIHIEMPMLKHSLLAGFILVFIDTLKELPLTLLLRPFNYDSLASLVYVYAGDERIHEASIPSLAIVSISLVAVIILEVISASQKRRKNNEVKR